MASYREDRLLADDFLGVPALAIIDGDEGNPFPFGEVLVRDGVPQFSDSEESDLDVEEYDEVTDSSEWTFSNESLSEDSGYSSVYSEEDDDHIPPEFPPHPPQHHITPPEGDLPDRPQFVVCLGRISPFGLWDLQESFAEDSDSSASVPSSSQKRSREDSDGDRSSAKRPRESCEESPGEEQSFPDSTPSTSGFSSPLKSRCGIIDLTVKRPRWDDDSDSD
ncbi:uncharacterized protein LOC121633687 [Melanotaenia boesemani]|uniref:uncharacterized protein LOC121633685 n=1 Tax=Melanotaenia boesemani TaxID=1250792 RepID=UPI001C046866|nr:uncharacterized protein LOC121633685 [Melanotaenia boesemani]XP_041831814.1 uncharacterized protein LOC121633687 [Melanotaenia boesemani]